MIIWSILPCPSIWLLSWALGSSNQLSIGKLYCISKIISGLTICTQLLFSFCFLSKHVRLPNFSVNAPIFTQGLRWLRSKPSCYFWLSHFLHIPHLIYSYDRHYYCSLISSCLSSEHMRELYFLVSWVPCSGQWNVRKKVIGIIPL